METLELQQWENINEEYLDYLDEQFVNPLKDLGYELRSCGGLTPENDSKYWAGLNVLIFEKKEQDETQEDMDRIRELMDTDELPQPVFQSHFGTLWVFIPYTT